jgi:hypothetical protein
MNSEERMNHASFMLKDFLFKSWIIVSFITSKTSSVQFCDFSQENLFMWAITKDLETESTAYDKHER